MINNITEQEVQDYLRSAFILVASSIDADGKSKRLEYVPYSKTYRVFSNGEEVYNTEYQYEAIDEYNSL